VTTRDPNELHDPRFEAAWRAASHEDPPPSLDDAIRAAARREVGAGPQRANRVPEALHPERWWWPLAAAATIGVVAIGLLQLADPDQVGAPASDKSIVTDMPAAAVTAKKPLDAERDAFQTPPREMAATSATSSRAGAPEPASDPERDRIAPAAGPIAPVPPLSSVLRKDAAPRAAPEERAETRATAPAQAQASTPASVPIAKSAPSETPKDSQGSAANAMSRQTVAEPFPADALKRESKESVAAVAAPPARSSDEAGAAFATGKLATTPAPGANIESTRDAQRAVAPPAAPAPQMAARRAQAGAAPLASAVAGAGTDAFSETKPDARGKVQVKLPVADWIALIRKLRDEGKIDEAVKELAAFRAAHADHALLLPPDLRNWQPAAK
jgi:hypothetical protein